MARVPGRFDDRVDAGPDVDDSLDAVAVDLAAHRDLRFPPQSSPLEKLAPPKGAGSGAGTTGAGGASGAGGEGSEAAGPGTATGCSGAGAAGTGLGAAAGVSEAGAGAGGSGAVSGARAATVTSGSRPAGERRRTGRGRTRAGRRAGFRNASASRTALGADGGSTARDGCGSITLSTPPAWPSRTSRCVWPCSRRTAPDGRARGRSGSDYPRRRRLRFLRLTGCN